MTWQFWSVAALLSILGIGGLAWAVSLPANSAGQGGVRGPDLVFTVVALGVSALAMWASRKRHPNYDYENDPARRALMGAPQIGADRPLVPPPDKVQRHLVDRKLRTARALLARDVGPLTFDVATHSDLAEIAEYRGLIHWHRDVVEKLLSLLLVLLFAVFLGRGALYLVDFLRGDTTLEVALRNDVHLAALFIGLALIVDGVLLVAAMTDAPGIGRTLDSLIVVLAGIVIVFFDPYKITIASVGSLGLYLVFAVAALFLVRWVIRHHTITEWRGR
jgi:hypothetical protein